ncbi:MAG: glycosyl transferase [Alkalinema sp. CACIAM 70d]|nr:MAG: glycosyl transferase [Alkalinema sp. CACIAM 70d]
MPVLQPLSTFAKSLHLGQLLYQTYHRPKGILQKTLKRGMLNELGDRTAQRQMETAAERLPSLTPSDNPAKIYFLSGDRFWYQTCFCAYSMIAQAGVYYRPVIYDDGTLDQTCSDKIRRIFPDAEMITAQSIEETLDQYLPANTFPTLRSRRLEYFNLRKLTDIHVNSHGWKLVLDSDMLFFRPPHFLIDWLKHPNHSCYMLDVDNAYGYSDALMTELAGAPIPDRINVGICGLNSDAIDWHELEYWCKTMIDREGTHYYQEQALSAMLMARDTSWVAPRQDYLLMPDRQEAENPQAVMHHYVADSKPWYFRYGWQHVAACAS